MKKWKCGWGKNTIQNILTPKKWSLTIPIFVSVELSRMKTNSLFWLLNFKNLTDSIVKDEEKWAGEILTTHHSWLSVYILLPISIILQLFKFKIQVLELNHLKSWWTPIVASTLWMNNQDSSHSLGNGYWDEQLFDKTWVRLPTSYYWGWDFEPGILSRPHPDSWTFSGLSHSTTYRLGSRF